MPLNKMLQLRFLLGFRNGFGVDRVGIGGGLILLWKEELEVSLQSYSVGHIDVLVKLSNGHIPNSFFFIGFYGNPITNRRKESWTLLRRIVKYR